MAETTLKKQALKPNTWYNVTFNSGWSNYAGFVPCQYMKDTQGFVHIRGLAQGGNVGTVPFALPAGFRPSGSEIFIICCNAGVGDVYVQNNGNLTINAGTNGGWYSFAGITFLAEA